MTSQGEMSTASKIVTQDDMGDWFRGGPELQDIGKDGKGQERGGVQESMGSVSRDSTVT